MNPIIDLITTNLPTHAERRLFFKMVFGKSSPMCLAGINLEGTPKNAAFSMWDWFQKQGKETELSQALNHYFN